VVEEARREGVPLRLVGRRRDALEALAREGEEVRVADAGDEAALIEAFQGCFAVASLAGPFLAVGPHPVAAAVAVGAHYLDTTGEQAFARLVYEGFGDSAAERDLVLLTAFGFDYVPGGLAAALAAEGATAPVDELVVGYAISNVATSAGTRRTIGHVMGQAQVAWENGAIVPSRFGATTRTMRFPFGEKNVVEWAGTEPLTVPRHVDVQRVRSYLRAPKAAAYAGLVSRLASPLVKLSGRAGAEGPSPAKRAKARWAVVAEARTGARGRRATLGGTDVYGFTARSIVQGAVALREGDARGAGALAPAEAFDARSFAVRLAPFLRIEAVDDL